MMLGSFYYKAKAKEALRGNWQTAMLIAFFSGILSTLLQVLQMVLLPSQAGALNAALSLEALLAEYKAYAEQVMAAPQQTWTVLLMVALAALLFSPALALGCDHYFVRLHHDEDLGFAGLFSRFRLIGKALWLYVRIFVQVFLWSLLLFIPGIIAAFRYSMAPYILAENQDITAGEALERSKAVMADKKMNLFGLLISFLGWTMLAMLLQTYLCEANFVLGTVVGLAFQVWIAAYQNAAVAKFYCVNSEKGGLRKAYDDMFGRFAEMGMDQETLDQMKAQTEENMQKRQEAPADDELQDAAQAGSETPENDEDILD